MPKLNNRQLAAILFADISGYTTMMGRDEAAALKAVNRMTQVLKQEVPKHSGQTLKHYGDGSLSIFSSAVAAVECALAIQIAMNGAFNVPLRIGMHLGEVLLQDGDVFGDSVNVAARIEAMGIPGAVLLSRRLYEEIRNKPYLPCTSLGEFQLKNVRELVEILALTVDGLNIPEKKNPSIQKTPFLNSKQRKSLLVLPFENRAGDPEQEYFSDGLTDELITDLSGLKALRVIARNATMKLKGTQKELRTLGEELQVQYALEGSVRRSGDDLRINVQLVDIEAGSSLWATRFTGKLDKIFDFQEEVSRSVVDALHVQLNQEEDEALAKRPIPNLVAYDYYLKARKEINTFSEAGVHRAIDYLQKGIDIVGENPLLLYGMGATYFQMLNTGASKDISLLAKIEAYSRRILELDPKEGRGYLLAGMYSVRKDFRAAVLQWRKALALNPGDPDILLWLGAHSLSTGQTAFGSALLEELARVEPLEGLHHVLVAYAAFFDGRLDDIEKSMLRGSQLGYDDNPIALWGGVRLQVAVGRKDLALQLLDLLLKNHSDTPFAKAGQWFCQALQGTLPADYLINETEFLAWVTNDAEFAQSMIDVCALAGMEKEAIEWLSIALKLGFINYPFLAYHNPFLDSIRHKKEFREILTDVKREFDRFNSNIERESRF